MVRFYKRIQDQWFYKECWQDGDRVIFHHGVVGNEGKVDSEPCLDFSAYYNSFKRKYEKQGYSEFSPDHAETIVLKYALKSSEEAESITKSVIPLLNGFNCSNHSLFHLNCQGLQFIWFEQYFAHVY